MTTLHPSLYFLSEGRYMTSGGFEFYEDEYGVLMAPQEILEPLSLASLRKAMQRGESEVLWFSPDSPARFHVVDRPRLREDIQLNLHSDGRFGATVTIGRPPHGIDDELTEEEEAIWTGETERWHADLRSLLAPLLSSYRCNDLDIHEDTYDPNGFVAAFTLPTRLKTVEQALHIAEHATALLQDSVLGPLTRQRTVELSKAGFVQTLIGRVEGPWFDGKGIPYRLKEVPQKWELAKDVASFANADDGGVIVIGAKTESQRGRDVVVEIKDVPLTLIDAESYRKCIRARVHPHIVGLEIRTMERAPGRGVAIIHVPPQADDLKPFVVRGVLRRGRIETSFVSIPIRDGEGTAIAHAGEIHQLLAAGRAALERRSLPDP